MLNRSAPLGLAALAAGVALGVGAERIGGPPQPEATGDLAAGLALLGGGTVAWVRRARGGCAGLMVLTGGAWFAGDLSDALLYAHRGPLVHLLLAYPSGRLRSRATGALVAIAYVDGLVPAIARSTWPTVVLMTAVVVAAAARYRAAGGAERRARAVALAATSAIGGTLVFAAISRSYRRPRRHRGAVGLLRRGDGHRGRADGGSAVGALDARGRDRPGDRSRRSP